MTIDTTLLFTGAAILFLIVMSFLFSGTETGMTAASRARLHALGAAGDQRARDVERLLGRNVASLCPGALK